MSQNTLSTQSFKYLTMFPTHFLYFFLMRPRPLRSTLFPYTTLFRSYLIRPEDLIEDACARLTRNFTLEEWRSEEHTSELQSRRDLVCRLLLEKKKTLTRNDWSSLSSVRQLHRKMTNALFKLLKSCTT